jgi:hypothetical protein
MKAQEVVLVSGQFQQQDGSYKNQYAVKFEDGSYKHHQDIGIGVTFKGWQNAIVNTHKHYVLVEEFTPKVVHPYKEELSQAFDLEEISIADPIESKLPPVNPNVDMETGEIKEDPQTINNNPLKQKEMEAKTEVPVNKVSLGSKIKWYSAVGAGVTVRTVTVPTHVVLQSAADILQIAANGVRNFEAFSIDKLKVSKGLTRAEIRGRIDQRTERIERFMIMPVTIPIGIMQSVRESLKSGDTVEPVTA